MSKSISKIVVRKLVDQYPDFSTYGEYTNEKSDWVIDVKEGDYVYNLEEEGQLYCLECEALTPHNRMKEGDWEKCSKCGTELSSEHWETLYETPEKGREYRFFKPYAGGEEQGSENYQKYGLQDFERMQAYNRGSWCYMGVVAEAQITVDNVLQTITSGGVYGLESDCDQSDFDEIKENELFTLEKCLLELGFKTEEVTDAINKAEWSD